MNESNSGRQWEVNIDLLTYYFKVVVFCTCSFQLQFGYI